MRLAEGARLGSYEILSALGAGGMGEVYRARDTQLDRHVAIKVLPETFVADTERVARFEREAKVLASLNHPHIAAVYGLDEADGVRALVMELVEGEDLAQRLTRGPIPLEEALLIAKQVAEALEAAHEHGVIHRDLKPANIKLRPDGTAKVLDFGLAKALDPAGASGDLANSPTLTFAATQAGVILGTAAYMSPEQARGMAVDKRADIWAFGCVLYEMLSGRRPFAGEDITDTLALVLTKDIDLTSLPAQTPVALRTLVRRCLQRNPKERLHDIADARLLLQDASGPPEAAVVVTAPHPRSAYAGWIVACLTLVVGAIAAVTVWRRPAPAQAVTRFVIPPVEANERLSDPVLPPDGSFIVFKGDQLYIRRLSEFESHALPGTARALLPFLSPDARWVGFFADGKMKKVPLAGGDPVPICDADSFTPGAAWGAAKRIFFTRGWLNAPLVAVSEDGGPVTEVSTLDRGQRELGHYYPEPLPDGRHLIFTIYYAGAGIAESQIAVLDLATGQHRPLFQGALARYAAGQLLFLRAGLLHTVPFDPATLRTTGSEQAVRWDVRGIPPGGALEKPYGVSSSGVIAYRFGDLYPERQLRWLDRAGRTEDIPLRVRGVQGPFGNRAGVALSPDGTQLAFNRFESGARQISLFDLARHFEQPVASPGWNFAPIWHPDGVRVGFTSLRKGDFDVYVAGRDGGSAEGLLTDDRDEELLAWGPGGSAVLVNVQEANGSRSLVLVDPKSSERTPLVSGTFLPGAFEVSPDGRWMALVTNPAGRAQLYIRPTTGAGDLRAIGEPAWAVHWSARSNELFLHRGLDVVAIRYAVRDGRFTAQPEQVLTHIGPDDAFYGVSPDGQRFLIGRRTTPSEKESGLRVVVNGLAALKESETR